MNPMFSGEAGTPVIKSSLPKIKHKKEDIDFVSVAALPPSQDPALGSG